MEKSTVYGIHCVDEKISNIQYCSPDPKSVIVQQTVGDSGFTQ